jgi:hypothetical protein
MEERSHGLFEIAIVEKLERLRKPFKTLIHEDGITRVNFGKFLTKLPTI